MPLWSLPPVKLPHGPAWQEPVWQEAAPGILVRSKRTIFRANGVIEYQDGVEALYDVITIKADRLVLHTAEGEGYGEADGNVHIIDPEAKVTAKNLKFNWTLRTGEAHSVKVDLPNIKLEAETLNITPEQWEALNVRVKPFGNSLSFVDFRSRRVVLLPGRRATAKKPDFYVGSKRIFTLPTYRFNLDPRTNGITLPSVAFRKDKGLGVTWSNGILLNEQTNLAFGFGAFESSRPTYDLQVTKSFVPAKDAKGFITPKSELGERFAFGYMERIDVDTPDNEDRTLASKRHSISVGTFWNKGANIASRGGKGNFSKLIEGTYEVGGDRGWFSEISQYRLHAMREGDGQFKPRALLNTSLALKSVVLNRGTALRFWVVRAGFAGAEIYGLARGSSALVCQPVSQLRLAAAYVIGGDTGRPMFEADRLESSNAIHLRADVNLGATKFSYLTKYDRGSGKWFGREYSASQVMGAFEPFIVYRSIPSDYRFGIRLRADSWFEILRSRDPKRKKDRKVIVSPPVSKPPSENKVRD